MNWYFMKMLKIVLLEKMNEIEVFIKSTYAVQ